MKRLFVTILIMLLVQCAWSQLPSQLAAQQITVRMKDSLSLSTGQQLQLYAVNLNIIPQLYATNRQYNSSDSLSVKLRHIERSRDSLYSTVFTTEQMNLYRSKKRTLVYGY